MSLAALSQRGDVSSDLQVRRRMYVFGVGGWGAFTETFCTSIFFFTTLCGEQISCVYFYIFSRTVIFQ